MKLVRDPAEHVEPKGPFEIVGEIGRGGFGAVFLGWDAAGMLAAVKIHRPPPHADEDSAITLLRFRREIDFLKQFAHPRVPGLVLASDPEQAGEPWYATRYVPGPSLHTVVQLHGRLHSQAVLHLAVQLADVLRAVHRIGTHRDLTPANVLLTAGGAHVVDFGLAHTYGAAPLTRLGRVIASKEYVALERLVTASPESPDRSDIFTLGGTLLYAATGQPPYPDATWESRLKDRKQLKPVGVPGELEEIITGCLQSEPGARPTAGAVLERAQELITTQPFAAALGLEIAEELENSAAGVLRKWRPPHGPRRTAPQMPVHGHGPGWSMSVGDWVQSVVPIPGRVVVVTVGGEVVILAEADGSVVERFHLRARPTGAVAAFEECVYVGDDTSGVHVVGRDAPTRIRVAGRVQGCVPTATGVVVATADSRLYRIDGRSTAIDWRGQTAAMPAPGGLACSGETVYVGTVDGVVHRHEVTDGVDLGQPHHVGHAIVSVAAHRFGAHVVAADGKVYGLRGPGEPGESIPHPGPVRIGRAAGDTLVTCTSNGLIRSQDVAGAAPPVDVATLGPVRRSLTVSRDLVVTGRVDGSLHVLRLPQRTQLWQVGDGPALDAPAAVTANETVVAGWANGTVAAFPAAM